MRAALPEIILEKFRTVALQRIERIQHGWAAMAEHPEDEHRAQEVHREIHTLKGDARVVGFIDVNTLCQKLEELFHVAHERAYRVPEDFDLVVRMGLQFAAVLVRAKPGANVPGIDMPSFHLQLQTVLAAAQTTEAEEEAPTSAGPDSATMSLTAGTRHVPPRMRDELAAQATVIYLEALNATGPSQHRLLGAWRALADISATLGGEDLKPRLERFVHAASKLATEAAKEVKLRVDLVEGLVATEVAAAVEVAVLHAVRNAIAHGIETPDERRAVGKAPAGWIEIRAVARDGYLELRVEDDGRGIELEAVRRRAVESGLVPAETAAGMSEKEILRLVFRPGFSTATSMSESSGRGIGLDAVSSAVMRLGGTVSLRSRQGAGAMLVARLPHVSEVVDALLFAVPGCPRRIAVPDAWRLERTIPPDARDLLIVDALGLRPLPSGAASSRKRIALRRESAVVAFEVTADPQPSRLRRLCPTSVGAALEIARVGDEEVVLVRPDRLETFARPEASGPSGAPSGAALRLLLIDDSEIVRDHLRASFELEAFEVESVGTIDEFRAAMDARAPDVVVSDVQMPTMSGTDVCREVRARGVGRAPIPVILVSDFPESQLEELAWASGAHAYVTKSLGPTSIARRVRELVEVFRAPK